MICRSSDICYRFGNDRILSKKHAAEVEVYKNEKLQNKLRQIHYIKNYFLWFMLGLVTVMRILK